MDAMSAVHSAFHSHASVAVISRARLGNAPNDTLALQASLSKAKKLWGQRTSLQSKTSKGLRLTVGVPRSCSQICRMSLTPHDQATVDRPAVTGDYNRDIDGVIGAISTREGEAAGEEDAFLVTTSGGGYLSVQETAVERQKKKIELVQAIAKSRKTGVDAETRDNIMRLIEELEAMNPIRDTATDFRLGGKWSLLYTAPTAAAKDPDVTGRLEGPFLARFRGLNTGPTEVKQRSIMQIIDSREGTVSNAAKVSIGGLPGELTIEGETRPVTPLDRSKPAIRVIVTFTSFSFKLADLPSVTFPLTWVSPTGWIETTYLDYDIRISRGDKGSVFVAARARS